MDAQSGTPDDPILTRVAWSLYTVMQRHEAQALAAARRAQASMGPSALATSVAQPQSTAAAAIQGPVASAASQQTEQAQAQAETAQEATAGTSAEAGQAPGAAEKQEAA